MYHQQGRKCGSRSKSGKKDKEFGLGILKLKFLQNFSLKLTKGHKLLQDEYSLSSMYHRGNSEQIHTRKETGSGNKEVVTNNLNNEKTCFFPYKSTDKRVVNKVIGHG